MHKIMLVLLISFLLVSCDNPYIDDQKLFGSDLLNKFKNIKEKNEEPTENFKVPMVYINEDILDKSVTISEPLKNGRILETQLKEITVGNTTVIVVFHGGEATSFIPVCKCN